jgi:predicted MFS family arabinose efflux permease
LDVMVWGGAPWTVTTTSIRPITRPERVSHGAGFWVVAFAFVIGMAFSTIPTPLWSLYRRADHFSTLMVTVAFAAYAVGVIVSLFLAGHVSDWVGRRRVLIPALALEAVAAVLFLTWTSLPGLIVARFITGLGVGMITATATAHLAELYAIARPGVEGSRPGVVAVAANLGGLALGPLVAGVLVQFVAGPLVVPDAIFLGLLLVAALGVWLVPETVRTESRAYRPQRVTVPADARARYFAVTTAAFGLFAIMGLFTSLAPSLLSSIGATSPLVGGFAAFLVFASAAAAQVVLGDVRTTRQLTTGLSVTAVGLVVLAIGVATTSVVGFLVGGLVAGAGAGVLLKGALGTAAQLSPPESRAEALAGVFLGAYVGVVVPVVGVGLASNDGTPLATAFVAFAVLDLVILAGSAVALRRNPVAARA